MVFRLLRDCIDFLENTWNRFTDWLDSLIDKVIASIESWLNSISYLLEVGFILITDGLTNWVIEKNKAQRVVNKLEKEYGLKDVTSDKLLSKLKADADYQHVVSTTSQEKDRWQQTIGNKETIYTTF